MIIVTFVQVRNLTKSYGGVLAINNVSFKLEKGEMIGLIGPNGSGKTTLFDLFYGYLKPDSGEIWYKSRQITGMKPHQIAELGVGRTFQITRVFKRMTALENLLAVEKDLEMATNLLDTVGLTELTHEYAQNLSGGQQKLLELARVLMLKSELILMDEPMAGVTPVIIDKLVEIINSLNKEGVACIIIQHDISLVLRLCKRVIVLDEGEKIADESATTIQDNPRVIEAYIGE